MAKLSGTKPTAKTKRAKMFWYGKAGVGKTVACTQIPNAYIIDCENGTDEYAELVNANNSVVFKSNDPDAILHEIRLLRTEEHPFTTLVIDPITIIYSAIQEKWTQRFEAHSKDGTAKELQDFGMRYWGNVKKEYKRLLREIDKLDMNVVITAHQKDVYGEGFQKVGTTWDAMKGDDYFFDIIFQITRKNGKLFADTIKERALPGKTKFSDGFEWSYDNFAKLYGRETIERKATPVEMATEKMVTELEKLLEVVKIPDKTIEKWMKAADVEDFSEMTARQITGCIKYCQDQADSLKGVK